MPTLDDLRSRVTYKNPAKNIAVESDAEESLISDVRNHMSPAQFVEQKLRAALDSKSSFKVLVGPQGSQRRKSK